MRVANVQCAYPELSKVRLRTASGEALLPEIVPDRATMIQFRVSGGTDHTLVVDDPNFEPVERTGIRAALTPIELELVGSSTLAVRFVGPDGNSVASPVSVTALVHNETFPIESDPWLGATIRARPDVLGMVRAFSFELSAEPSSDGERRFRVPPGSYRLVADTPGSGRLVTDVDAVQRGETRQLTLAFSRGGVIAGRVDTSKSARSCDAALSLRVFRAGDELRPAMGHWFPGGVCPSSALGIGHEIQSIEVPPSGKFATVRVDPGKYRLQLRCGGNPWFLSDVVEVKEGASLALDLTPLD
ncbi:MAG: hypothetical protein K8S98_10145 [Planctomycetes bacterium]|nr:hypothetical protein [Planctomycetota bacterium]